MVIPHSWFNTAEDKDNMYVSFGSMDAQAIMTFKATTQHLVLHLSNKCREHWGGVDAQSHVAPKLFNSKLA